MLFYLLSIVLFIFDQVIKYWVVHHLALHQGLPFIRFVLSLYYLQNRGAAWGMLAGHMWFFIPMTLLVVGAIITYYHREKLSRKGQVIGLACILAGALGNFVDRIRLGYVVDMFRLEFIDFPVFNFADACLTVGAILLIIDALFLEREGK